MDYSKKPTIKLLHHIPEEIVVSAALGCFEEKSSAQILDEIRTLPEDKKNKKIGRIFEETSGRGHGAVLDHGIYIFSAENVTRQFTLHICQLEYGSFLQQSLRRVNAERGYNVPTCIQESKFFDKTTDILNDSFSLYEKMKNDVPAEDARYGLPVSTLTNIHITADARTVQQLHGLSRSNEMPSSIREPVQKMIDEAKRVTPEMMKERETNYETLSWKPTANLFGQCNVGIYQIIDNYGDAFTMLNDGEIFPPIGATDMHELIEEKNTGSMAKLKHHDYKFQTEMSLTTFHQAIRQRTWDHYCESIYDAADRGKYITPPTIENSVHKDAYKKSVKDMIGMYKEMEKSEIPKQEAAGVLPHSLMIYDIVRIDAWNAIHGLGKRLCKKAQWEIRHIAEDMAKAIKTKNPEFGKYVRPQCMTYGRCPEKEPCGYFKGDKI